MSKIGGVDKIGISYLDMNEIVNRVFTNITRQMIALKMQKLDKYESLALEKHCFEIQTEGAFDSWILFEMDKKLYDKIAIVLHKSETITAQEKKIYVVEYLNVICGRILSEINNKLGKRSRLSVPTQLNQKAEYPYFENQMNISYSCLDGFLNIKMCFDILV